MSGIVLDLILAALLLFFLWRGYSKGFVLTLCGLLAVFVALIGGSILADALARPVARAVVPALEGHLRDSIGSYFQYAPPAADSSVPDTFFSDLTLSQALEALQGTALFGGLAEAFAQAVDRGAESVAAGVIQALAEYAAVQLTRAVLFLVCFIAVLAAWTLLSRALDLAFRLPVLSTLNHWAGALMGLATGVLVAVIALWLLGDFLPRQALADSVLLSLALRTDLAAFLPR